MAIYTKVNGMEIVGVATSRKESLAQGLASLPLVTNDIDELLAAVDAVIISSDPLLHHAQVEHALKGGKIGKVVSVDATCTTLRYSKEDKAVSGANWGGMGEWGPIALLPIFQLLGTNYTSKQIVVRGEKGYVHEGEFTKIDLVYPTAVASMKVATGVKSEGELIISGTDAYVYVPAPWWKTDYFEIRYENPANNKRYFYQLEGEGFRYELITFVQAVSTGRENSYIARNISSALCQIMGDYYNSPNTLRIN
ncbi:hypothetical protein [Lancefieldella rimae]|uniref:hypothetical protein n=1 Tax=Lancefieldella rimae TaxID=1383 RepID=UPI001CB47A23|nr:hypothetical protein [Lancefieldella rimae]MBF4804245.1 hypothetical protein [Lancefieldella rimae]